MGTPIPMSEKSFRERAGWTRRALVSMGLVWMSALVLGFTGLVQYQAGPGSAASAPVHWPSDCSLARADREATLLVFAHPQCPCTRATIGELDRIAARCGG